jgi:hypothetical protein
MTIGIVNVRQGVAEAVAPLIFNMSEGEQSPLRTVLTFILPPAPT